MTDNMILPAGAAGAWRAELAETSRLGRIVAAVRARLEQYAIYRQTLAELQSLSDRELDDIGIARADIRQIARETAYARR